MLDDEAEIQYRVAQWLEHIGAQWARLRDLDHAEQALDEGADGVKAATFEAHGRGASHSDPVAELVAKREEKRRRIEGERDAIAEQIHGAAVLLNRAWSLNPGVDDASFAYLRARYCEGKSKADASRAAGLTSFAAMCCARKVAVLVYQADPSRFGRRPVRVEYDGRYAGLRAAEDQEDHDAADAGGR